MPAEIPPEVLEVHNKFAPLYNFLDYGERMQKDPPLLAHYTSLEAFERIMATSELWFSNPLFMNDLEELRFAAQLGSAFFINSDIVRDAAGSATRRAPSIFTFSVFRSTPEATPTVFSPCGVVMAVPGMESPSCSTPERSSLSPTLQCTS
jgi:hypothetical protein